MSDDSVFQKHYEKLNEAQQKAVDIIDGPVLVVAGPGSGKTEILSVRAANILKKTDAYASDILCLTFTESAEINMRQRLNEIIGGEANYVKVHTFHNFCRRIRESFPSYFGVTTDFSVADDIVRTEILENLFVDMSHDNPLRSHHPELGFIYMKPVMNAIDDLKQAGLTSEEFKSILTTNREFIEAVEADINQVFSQRVSKSIFEDIEDLLATFEREQKERPVPHFRSLAYVLSTRLTRALKQAKEEESTKPITEFKNEHTVKTDDGRRILKTDRDTEKMMALAQVYEDYEEEKHRKGYYDFNDMILEVIQELESEPELRAAVAEQNQYMMIDEFQDTNDAQLRLLLAIAQEAPTENPNLMAVGDDDQAIYRFQGAEVSNILNFKHVFSDTDVVTLTKNYRSHQEILDAAHAVISQGDERLDAIISEVEKSLEAAGDIDQDVSVKKHSFRTRTHHNHAIAQRAKKLIEEKGVSAEEIAVLGRKHKDLEALVPYFHEADVPITYERQQDVLAEEHIRQLVTMCRFVVALTEDGVEEAQTHLPEILSYPFWNLDRKVVWELSLKAKETGKDWLACMQEHSDSTAAIAEFFMDVSGRATYEPAEQILDMLVGSHETPGSDSKEADAEFPGQEEGVMQSPFKKYYFSKEKLEEDPAEYLRFLSSLKTFVFSLREHKEDKILTTHDLLDFVDTHQDNNLVVTDTSPFVNSNEAVNLMTAHKAKGQEFGAVILAGAVDDIWANSRSYNRIRFPENLPIQFSGDTVDDQLRLLFVAMTRAKHTLDIVSFEVDDSGAQQVELSFLSDANIDSAGDEEDLPSTEALLESSVPQHHVGPYTEDEKAVLYPKVENYQLSVTHLNNFLDVRYGGPENFLTSNLLRFPQPMSKPQVYGSAVHTALERVYIHLKKEDERPTAETVIGWFAEQINRARISKQDREYLIDRGKDSLSTFLDERMEHFQKEHFSEYDFGKHHVKVDGVPLSGKIDKMVVGDEQVQVHDFKTGTPLKRWSKASAKSQSYRRQLIFYKLLVENTADFKDKQVDKGVLEFVEPKDGSVLTLEAEITKNDTDRLRKLIQIIYECITNLDFPDVTDYNKNARGIRNFKEDLLKEAS